MQTSTQMPGMADANRTHRRTAVADLIGLLQQAISEGLHGAVIVEIPAKDGLLGEHSSRYERHRRNLTNYKPLPHNAKELNDSRLRVAVDRFGEMADSMIADDFAGSLSIEIVCRHGMLKDPVTTLRRFHRS